MEKISDELLEIALQKLGKTREQFEQEVEELKKSSSIEVMGNLVAIMMESMNATANMLSLVMMQNASLQDEIKALKGGNTSA
ncbi:hypothetical protein CEQ21_24350 [Niallia circulans]|uniref:Uncharacterized protein n=1 Tax=Niallia circulans TaxID=1397 RepID=A0A553SNE9_NIACI|nr:hypothetical protein [Niallia circulans]TRZ38520.1 hypothetical protein CEQ21_24350 [Niallia circulans]